MWSPPGSSAQFTIRPSTCAQRNISFGSMRSRVIRGSRSRCLNQPRLVPPLIQNEPSVCSNQTGTISTEPSLRFVPMIAGKTSWVKACILGLSVTAIYTTSHLNRRVASTTVIPSQMKMPSRSVRTAQREEEVANPHWGGHQATKDPALLPLDEGEDHAEQPCLHDRQGNHARHQEVD